MKKIIHKDFEFIVNDIISNINLKFHPKFNRFLSIAKGLSLNSEFYGSKVGAIIVQKGKIISKGFNSYKSHPLQKRYNNERTDINDNAPHYIHAEIDALKRVKDIDLTDAELFVYHIGKNNLQKLARPCAACMTAIKEMGIETIHYSTPEGLATEYINPSQKIIVKKAKKLI